MLLRKVFLSAATTAGLLLAPHQAAYAAEAGAAEAPGLEEIVVTARKRAEDILKTPVAVAAFTSEDIAVRGIVSVNDLANSTPSINISNISSGRNDRSFQQISLRGFTPSTATSTLTASFIDGVPVASATALNSISDPARIEILKGPQSAYFGRNTFAGAINVVNKLPGDKFGGNINAIAGTRSNYDIQGAIEGPLVADWLSFRLGAHTFSKAGSYRNQADPAQTLGDQKTQTGTLFLVAKPVEGLSIKFFGLLSKDQDGPSAQGQLSAYEVRANAGALNIPAFSGNSNGTVILPSVSNCALNGLTNGDGRANDTRTVRPFICGAAPSLVAGFSPAQNTVEDRLLNNSLANGAFRVISPSQGVDGYGLKRGYSHLHLNVDYDFGNTGFSLASLTGINEEYYSELADLDNYDNTLLRNPFNPTNANQNIRTSWDFPFVVEAKRRDFSQEFRLSYDNKGPFTGVVGVSYLKTKAWSDLVSVFNEIIAGGSRASSTTSPPQKAETQGVFFGINYQLTEQFKVSAEGRYQQDEIFGYTGGNSVGTTIRTGNLYGLTPGLYGPLSLLISKKFTNFLPRVIAQWDVNNNLMAYASWSKGVNVGLSTFNTAFLNGSQAIKAAADFLGLGVVVQPEKLTNYEIGLKGKFFDGRVRGSLALYHAIWSDEINTRSTVILDNGPDGTGTVQIVSGSANSGKVIAQGIELDVTATPIDRVVVNLAVAMNDSDIRSFTDPSISRITGFIGDNFKGKQLPAASKFSANLGIQYGTALPGVENGTWFMRGDLSYKDKQYVDPANLTWIKARSLVNFRAGVSKGPVALEAFVNNAFNDSNYVSIAENTILVPNFSLSGANSYLNVGLPDLRTYGVKVSYKF